MKKIIVMVGIPGSGKSTKALEIKSELKKLNGEDTEILSSDSLRLELFGDEQDQSHNSEVFKELFNRARNFMKTNCNIIIDATNVTTRGRREIFQIFNSENYNQFIKIAYVMTTSIYIAKERNHNRKKVVPDYVIDNQVKKFEIPFYEEGFDEIILDNWEDFTNLNIESYNHICNMMDGFDQKNPYHQYNLGDHCKNAATYYVNNYANNAHSFTDKDIYMMQALRIHDFAKLYCGTPDEKDNTVYHYYGHANIGAYMLLQNIDAITFTGTKDDVLNIIFLINYHMLHYSCEKEKTKERYKRFFGEKKYKELEIFHECDKNAH